MSQTPWVTELEASICLGVDQETLRKWREIGYLKQGTHWRRFDDEGGISLQPTIFYHLRWSKEVIEYWKNHDAPINDLAA